MKTESFDDLGDRMKRYEMAEAGRTLMPGLPIMARLDGRAFHTFTRGLAKPYDRNFLNLMDATTKFLIEKEHATLGYTQSDEITLCWIPSDVNADLPFSGRIQKLESVLAGMASAVFTKHLPEYLPAKSEAIPHFDCRVWNVPNLEEVYNTFKWRELDATKNSLTMLAHAHFSHKQLQGKKGRDKHELLHSVGVNWNNEPARFKRGSYFKRVNVLVTLSEDQLAVIPEKHRPSGPVVRSVVTELQVPPITTYLPEGFVQEYLL